MSRNKGKGGMVYSTNSSYMKKDDMDEKSVAPEDQNLKVSLDSKRRRGKVVILVSGFQGPEEDGKELCKILKQYCGAGGSYKDGELIIQGSMINKVKEKLKSLSYNYK